MSRINLGITLIASVALSACGYDLRIYSKYENLDEARADGAMGRGWIPDWLPENAIDIHEHHDLDTNVRAISFSVDQTEEWPWPIECIPVETATRPQIRTELFPRAPHRFDEIQDCAEVFAVRDSEGVVHMWSIPGF